LSHKHQLNRPTEGVFCWFVKLKAEKLTRDEIRGKLLGMLSYFLFALGFPLLIKGADWLLNGATAISHKIQVSGVLVGLTIVAFGTSLPELIVTLFATAKGEQELLVSGIIGSNIANIFLILGVGGIIYPITVRHETIWREIPLSLLAAIALGIMSTDIILNKTSENLLTRGDSLLLLTLLIVFLYYLFSIARSNRDKEQTHPDDTSSLKITFQILAGLIGLYFGGQLIVDNALIMAQDLGISQSLVGASLVALGTSLPELITSIVAATKKQPDIVVGNVIGSNIFNIFLILGLNGVLSPILVNQDLGFDILLMVFAHLLLFMFLFIGQRHVLQRSQAWVFLAIYGSYLVFLLIRQ
jgi:cation:H+ antiporter